jgi:hypothetical protein
MKRVWTSSRASAKAASFTMLLGEDGYNMLRFHLLKSYI